MRISLKHNLRLSIGILALCSIVSAQVIMVSPMQNSVQSTNHIAVTIVGKPGAPASLFVNKEPVASGEIRIDGVLDFINIKVPAGPNELMVQAVGARDRTYTAKRQIHVLGSPKRFVPYEADIELPADGRSKKAVSFEVQDEWGYQLDYVKLATVTLTDGNIVDKDIHSDMTGVQVKVTQGVFTVTIQAPDAPKHAVLEIEINGEFEQVPVTFTTPITPLILVGIIRGTASNFVSKSGNEDHPQVDIMDVRDVTYTNDYVSYGGKSAFYAKGGIGKGYRLTASYDSDRNEDDKIFEDVDPDEPVPLYGDGSRLTYDAQSKSKFFARLDRNESFILAGDYNTSFNSTEFAANNRSFNGLLSNLQSRNHSLVGYASVADHELARDEILGEGISGFYYLSHGNVMRFSEKIRIEVRDRYHPETVIKSTEQFRFQDYDINYVDGTLLFKQPISSKDGNGNPTYIIVFYEYRTQSSKSLVGGLRYEGKILDRLNLGSTYIHEQQSESDYFLYGVDAKLPLFTWLAFKGEFAASSDPSPGGITQNGQAFKTELNFTPFRFLSLEGYYRKVDSTFVNRSQSRGDGESGTEKYGAKSVINASKFGKLTADYYYQGMKIGTVNETDVTVLSLFYENKLGDRGLLKAGYEESQRIRNSKMNQSKLLKGQLNYSITDKLSATLENDYNLDPDNAQTKPNSTDIGLRLALTKKIDTYLKYRVLEGNSRDNQAIIGFDSKVAENTELTGKYEIGGIIGDKRNRASIGLRNQWQAREDLTLNFAYENTALIDSLEIPTPDNEAISFSFEYLPEKNFKLTGKHEYRQDKSTIKRVTSYGTDFKVYTGLSALAKIDYVDTKYTGGGKNQRGNYLIGLAYRPNFSDVFNSLVKLAYVTDENTHVEPRIRYDRMIISMNSYWQPLSRLEFGARIAKRQILDEEGDLFSDQTITEFYSLRTEFELSLKWSTILDLRYIQLKPLNESKTGISFEIDYLLLKNMQVGLGYMIKSYQDPDFSYLASDRSSVYFTINMKLSESILDWR